MVRVCLPSTLFTMSSVDHDLPNDLEPRQLPKPAPRFDSPPVPSVPEVSLVFDKPRDSNNSDYNVRRSPSMDKYDSYATWKQSELLANCQNPVIGLQNTRRSVRSTLERCHSQGDATQLHKNVFTNESLKHSSSDPSLTKKINALNGTRDHHQDHLQNVVKNHQSPSPGKYTVLKSNSRNQNHLENYFRQADGNGQQLGLENDTKVYSHSNRQHNAITSHHKHDNKHTSRLANPHMWQQKPDYNLEYDPNMQKLDVNQFGKSPNAMQSDYMNPALQSSNFHSRIPHNRNFHPDTFPRYHQFPPYCDSEYAYPYPHPYPSKIQSERNENNETVKNLLQLINNQSEQIKSLQSQVERLLTIQEDSLKERGKCTCSHNTGLVNENYGQNTQLSIQTSYNNPVHCSENASKLSRDDSMVSQRHNGTVERNMIGASNVKEMKKNLTYDYNNQNHEGRANIGVREDQLKNKILEQKVSIGVMTSFEFTVQNNPFAVETEERPYYGQTQTEVDNICSRRDNGGIPEHGDVSRTCQNVFSRVSNLPLENIIEDSESHLSLSQQPSSNFHSSPTTDECRSSETTNRKIAKDGGSAGKSPECNSKFINPESLDDAPGKSCDNYLCTQGGEFPDTQKHLPNMHRLQTPKHSDNGASTYNPRTNVLQNQCYSEVETPGPYDHYKQASNDQNFNPQSQDSNGFSSAPSDITAQHNHLNQQIFGRPRQYRFGDQQYSNTQSPAQYSPGNIFESTGVKAQSYDPRSQQSPMNYVKERNRILSRAKSKQENCIEESMVLNSGELEINERPPPSPEPSIHVEMQEYSSDEESDKHGGDGEKQTAKVGWTFYNNVLGQVNQILQNSPITRNLNDKRTDKENIMDDMKNKATVETVKVATMEQLRQLGISFVDNYEPVDGTDTSNKKVTFDSSYYPRLEYRGNMTQATSTISETDTSMHMNALALKYLSDEQLGELALQKHGAETLKRLMVSNVQGTNMSFATMRYLERYQLLPTNNNPQANDGKRAFERPQLEELKNIQQPPSSSQMARMSCPSKILDISTLKQQPKLL